MEVGAKYAAASLRRWFCIRRMAGERANSDFGANEYAVRHRGDPTEKSLSRRVARASPLISPS